MSTTINNTNEDTERVKIMKNQYQVIVGNIGTVYEGSNYKSAYKDFKEYSELALNGYGRCAGEEVTMLKNGEILHEFAVERFLA